MTGSNRIWHEGVVKEVGAQTIEVAINNHSACSGCHAKGACGMSEVKQKMITATRPGFNITAGDKVIVYAAMGNAIYSVLLAYVIPSVVIVAGLFILLTAGLNEIIAAISSLGLIAAYFFILYLYRNRVGKKIKFTVEKIN